MHKMKIGNNHDMCCTPPCTRHRQTSQQQQKTQYVMDITIHYTETNTNNVNEAHSINEKEQRLVDSGSG